MSKILNPHDLLTQINTFKRDHRAIEGIFGVPGKLKNIYIPPGDWELSEPLILEDPVIISGDGPGISTLIYNGSGPAVTFLYTEGSRRAGIKDITITSNNPQIDTSGLCISNGNLFFVKNVEITNFNQVNSYGFFACNNSKNISIENSDITNNNLGLEITSTQGCSIKNCSLDNLTGNLLVGNSSNISWNGGENKGSPTSYGIKIEDGYTISIEHVHNNITTDIFAIETSGYRNESISINNCSFDSDAISKKFIKCNKVINGKFSNNRYSNLTNSDTAIDLSESTSIKIDYQDDLYPGSPSVNNSDNTGVLWSTGETEGVNNTNNFSSFSVLDVTKDLTRLGYERNAIRNEVGGGDPIQWAIDYFIANQDEFSAIYLPPGLYRTTKTLFAGANNNFTTVHMKSRIVGFTTSGSPLGGATIRFEGDGSGNEKIYPAFIIQGARGHEYSGITFYSYGNQHLQDEITANGYKVLYKPKADWIGEGVRTNPSSPHCVVAVDPFIPAYPAGDIDNCYPNWEKYYGNAVGEEDGWSNPTGSSAIVWRFCSFRGGYLGMAVSPPGRGPGVIDLVQNAENFLWESCHFTYNTVHLSQGQSQSRANELRSPKMFGAWICIDTEHCGPGGNAGNAPTITGAPNWGACKYIFNVHPTQTLEISNIYIESTLSLGKIGTGLSGYNVGASFTGCTFGFAGQAGFGAPNEQSIAFHLATWGIVTFRKCHFSANEDILRIWNASGKIIFEDCTFTGDGNTGSVAIGFNNINTVEIRNAHTYNSTIGPIFEDNPMETFEKYVVNPISETSQIHNSVMITQDDTVLHRGTFTVDNIGLIRTGDLVFLTNTAVTPELLQENQYPYGMFGPVGRISNITGTTVTVDKFCQNFNFDVAHKLIVIRWDNMI